MHALLLNLTAVERLATQVSALPPEFSRALGKDLEYARFGAALPDLPWFGGITFGAQSLISSGPEPRYSAAIHHRAPVAFGLKAAELVANGALVGTEAGLAFLAGYFTQLCVGRTLEPLMRQLLNERRNARESVDAARARILWAWSLQYMQELHGSPLVGTALIRTRLQVRKASGPRAIGGGMYELMRVCSLEALGESPSRGEVDGWLRGLYVFSLALGSPLGKLTALSRNAQGQRSVYRGPNLDVWATVEAGLELSRRSLVVLGGLIRRGSFTSRSRAKVFELLPEVTGA